MEYKDIKPLIDSIPDFGWMSSERQREYMFNLGKVTSYAAEIGTYKGLSAAIVGLGMKENNTPFIYFCIDSFESSNVELDGKDTYDVFINNMETVQLYTRSLLPDSKDAIIPIQGFSYDVVNKFEDKSLDWIYIDGSHETPDVLQDIELYHPKVKDGGLLLFHDHTWPSVRKGVDIAVRKNLIEAVEIFDDFGVYRKV